MTQRRHHLMFIAARSSLTVQTPTEITYRWGFKRSCEKAGVLTESRRREYYEKPTAERKRKQAAAVKRHLKKLQREQSVKRQLKRRRRAS